MRVAVVTEMGDWSASTRYRATQHVPALRERLGQVDLLLADDRPRRRPGRVGQVRYFASHARRYVGRWTELRKLLPTYDAVLVQRGVYPLGPGAAVAPLLEFSGRVVYDVDDALLDVKPSMEGKGALAHWLYGPQQARLLLGRADSLVVSTEVLAAQLSGSSRTPPVVLPTVPDPGPYSRTTHPSTRRSVVWAGTVGGLSYLDPLRSVFAEPRGAWSRHAHGGELGAVAGARALRALVARDRDHELRASRRRASCRCPTRRTPVARPASSCSSTWPPGFRSWPARWG